MLFSEFIKQQDIHESSHSGKYTQEFWDEKAKDYNYRGAIPTDSIAPNELSDAIYKLIDGKNPRIPVGYDHFDIVSKGIKTVNGVKTYAVTAILSYIVNPDDDLGVSEPAEDIQEVTFIRDIADPETITVL